MASTSKHLTSSACDIADGPSSGANQNPFLPAASPANRPSSDDNQNSLPSVPSPDANHNSSPAALPESGTSSDADQNSSHPGRVIRTTARTHRHPRISLPSLRPFTTTDSFGNVSNHGWTPEELDRSKINDLLPYSTCPDISAELKDVRRDIEPGISFVTGDEYLSFPSTVPPFPEYIDCTYGGYRLITPDMFSSHEAEQDFLRRKVILNCRRRYYRGPMETLRNEADPAEWSRFLPYNFVSPFWKPRKLDVVSQMAREGRLDWGVGISRDVRGKSPISTALLHLVMGVPHLRCAILDHLSAYEIANFLNSIHFELDPKDKERYCDPIRDVFRNLHGLDSLLDEGFGITLYGRDLAAIRERAIDVEAYHRKFLPTRPLFVTMIISPPAEDARRRGFKLLPHQIQSIHDALGIENLVGSPIKLKVDSDPTVFVEVHTSSAEVEKDYKWDRTIGFWTTAISTMHYRRRDDALYSKFQSFGGDWWTSSTLYETSEQHVVQYINIHLDRRCEPNNALRDPTRIRVEIVKGNLKQLLREHGPDHVHWPLTFRIYKSVWTLGYTYPVSTAQVPQWAGIQIWPRKFQKGSRTYPEKSKQNDRDVVGRL